MTKINCHFLDGIDFYYLHLDMKEREWLKKTLMLSIGEQYEASATHTSAIRNARDKAQIQSGRKYSTKSGKGILTVKRTA